MVYDPFKYKISELNDLEPRKGIALISEPFMMDHYFRRSVVYLTECHQEGTVGFMLNKPLEVNINDILVDFPNFDVPVYLGGPVQPQNLFYIHTKGALIPDSQILNDDLAWGGDFDFLKQLVAEGRIMKKDIRFFLGYSGWDFQQLQEEILSNSWFVQEVSNKSVMGANHKNLWKEIIQQSNPTIAQMANFPEDPGLN